MSDLTGGCQCGATRYAVRGGPGPVLVCHCTDCQKQSGSAFGLIMVVDEDAVRLTQGETRSFQGLSEAGRAKEMHFCPDCGTRLFHRNAIRPGKLSLRAGTLDDTSGLRPVRHIWTRSKQPWVTIPEGVESFETQG